MKGRVLAWATALSGAAVLGVFVAFSMLPQARAAAECLPPGSVVQFELARNSGDLERIFSASDSACRPLAIAAMDAVNQLDTRVFIPLYTLFCVCAALFLAGGRAPFAAVAVLAALAAAAGDYVETSALLEITKYLDDPSPLASFMSQALLGAWTKFGALAVHALACAGLCFTASPARRVLGVLMLLPAPGVLAAAYDHHMFAGVMNGAFALTWTALLAAALFGVIRRA